MKRIYWLLIAAVPVALWWLSQSGASQETKPAAPPQPKPEPAKSETPAEPVKDLPTPSNGTFPKPSVAVETPVAAPVEELPAPPAPAEQIEQAAEIAPPVVPQLETTPMVEETAVAEADAETVQIFDSKDQPLECQLVEISNHQALLRCPAELPEKEKIRLVLPFGDQAITVNAQLQSVEEGVSRLKIMTLKAGQKKRFEEYLAQRTL